MASDQEQALSYLKTAAAALAERVLDLAAARLPSSASARRCHTAMLNGLARDLAAIADAGVVLANQPDLLA